jgi:chromosome segregation protein
VTLDGDLVEKSGAMTGGSSSGSRYSFSKSGKGQLERVAERIHQLEDERSDVREELRGVEERLEDARDRQADAADQVRDVEASIERKEAERAELEERIDRLREELADIETDRERVSERMDELEGEIAEREAEIDAEEEAIEGLKRELRESDIPELTERAEEIRAEIDDIEDEMDDLDAELNELGLEKQYAEEAIEELHDDIETAQNRKADAEETIAELESEVEEREAILEEKRGQVADLEDELSELKGEREELKGELREAREARDEWKRRVDDVESELEELRKAASRLEWEVDELASQVGDYDPEEIQDLSYVKGQITKLENRMTDLEPVNMLAIDEYDRVESELEELQGKKDTLVEEAAGIRERIEGYEARKREVFMEAFEGIDEHFRRIFAKLSNGSGELHLENEEDPFDGGLTMKAQPADKPVQRLDAMSGGEKSLTALAFIFAIQRYNPAPFYALDEVDAFLDAANAELVGELVDDLASDAQFIVVSHRSALLERSERAIGVTMQGDNVSAVTGIDLSMEGVVADD